MVKDLYIVCAEYDCKPYFVRYYTSKKWAEKFVERNPKRYFITETKVYLPYPEVQNES